VLAAQLLFSAGLTVLASLIFLLVATAAGWDTDVARTGIGAVASLAERSQLRFLLGLNHLFMFVVAGGATVWLFYRNNWSEYLQVRRWPGLQVTGLAMLLMIFSLPMVLFLMELNKMLPLPEAFHLMESDTNEMLKGLLQMDHTGELITNLAIIAFLPALGEELVFRGVLQRQLMRRIANPWLALTVTAAIFSAIHFQFEGFLSRWLLGMVLGWLYWRTGNFWVSVAAHFFNNALQVLVQYAYKHEFSTVDLEKDIAVPWQFALGSAFLMWATLRLIDYLIAQRTQSDHPNTETT